jgi:cell division protein FtsN
MARRSRQATRRRKKQASPTPAWLWFVAGLCVGLGGAGLAYLHHQGIGPAARSVPAGAGKAPADQSSEAASPASGSRPRFEFYTILPEKEVTVPDYEIAPPSKDRSPPKPKPGATYVLQVGSFRKLAEADRLKASLALIGLEADIQTVTVNEGETWHRVRLGPFTDLKTLNATRDRLREHDMDAMVLRIKT